VFKRSEHLKRHIRSIHTLEKRKFFTNCWKKEKKKMKIHFYSHLALAYECPYQSCSKRFSRSDNLNQHIRIHRHTVKDTKTKENAGFSSFDKPSSFL
jgi:uncharacterized Zn-finger protein